MKFSIEKKASIKKREFKKARDEMIQKESLHIHDLINYSEFLELYLKYGKNSSEEEFADIFLDLSQTDYYSLKKNKCKILKKEVVTDIEIEKLKVKAIKELNLKSGVGKTYNEILDIYNFVPSRLSLVMFAEKVLDVSSHSLSCTKSNDTKTATIFNKTNDEYFNNSLENKELLKAMNATVRKKNKIANLKDEIATDKNLHMGDEINKNQFLELYAIYGNDFTEYDFARYVLGMSEGKAKQLINGKILKTQIWKDEIVSLDYLLKIRTKTIKTERLHIKDSIDYKKFKEIYKKHAGILSEIDFALEILDIPRTRYKDLKKEKCESTILSDIEVPEDFYSNAKNRIKQNENVYRGKRITKEEFLELYEKYGFVTEDTEFATKTLEMDINQYRALRRRECKKSRILKSEKNATPEEIYEEEVRKLREQVIRERKLHIEDPMTGKEFLDIYEEYGFGMSQKKFGKDILDIKPYRLDVILADEKERTIILKNEKIKKSEIKFLRKYFFNNSGCCTDDRITYQEFLRLYNLYGGKLSEKLFSEKILFMSNDRLIYIRNHPEKDAEILCRVKFSDAYMANLKAKVIQENLLYLNQGVVPAFFEKIYKSAHTILSRRDFARDILEVSRQSFHKCVEKKCNETFKILSVSGTYENKEKFLKRQDEVIRKMLEAGYGYDDIEKNVNLTRNDLIEKIESLYKNEEDKKEIMYKYLYETLRDGRKLDESRIKELKISEQELKKVKDTIQKEKKLEKKCNYIIDDVKETEEDMKTLREYVSLCRDIYKIESRKMSTDTLECLQGCLEFLDDDIENTKFFVKVCINQMEYIRANEVISFYMQSEKISVKDKSILREMRNAVREAEKRKSEILSTAKDKKITD